MNNKPAIIWLLIVILLLTHNAYLWLGKQITPDTDILALLPTQQQDPILQHAFNHMVDTAQQKVIVLVGADDWTQATHAADAYNAVINTRPDVLQMHRDAINRVSTILPFENGRLNLLTPQQRIALQTQPSQYWVDNALARLYGTFGGPKLGAWQNDPFGLLSDWMQTRAQETPVRPRDGKLFVADKNRSYALLIMDLCESAFSITAQQAVIPLLEQAKQAAQRAVPKAKVITTGVILHANAASQQAHREVTTIGLGSLLGILLLMWLTFRSLKPIILIGLSIGIGCLGALSLCWLLFGKIHLLTLVFGASLIGIAQDYGIYFLCSRAGANPALNSYQLLQHIGPGLRLTLAAAIIGYMGLVLTPFPGLRQMAVFCGLGLLFAWLTVICWFPVLVNPHTVKATRLANYYGASRTYWPLLRKNKTTVGIGLLFCLFVIAGWSRLTVNDDIRSLQKPVQTLINDQIKLSKLLDTPSPVQFYLIRGSSPEIVLQREELLKSELEPLIARHIISGYQALSDWVPSLQTQENNQKLIASMLLSINGPLDQLAQKIGENKNWANHLKKQLLNFTPKLMLADFLKTSASEPWHYLWLGKIDNDYASIVTLRGLNNYANLPTLQKIGGQTEGIQWVDKINEISAVLSYYRQTMSFVLLGAYIAIYLLLYLRYRAATWRVLTPPALASISTLALLGMIGISLQLFHVLALMLILGLGVDYGIFLQEQPDRHECYAWLTVGLSAISALLSFGLLALSRTPPLHAFGLTMLIGMAIVWLIAPCFGKK